ncbi:Uncharacterised protein [Mycobacteroides abscessus subsp. massiliense]|nr:Uncharacterised protein [Mycobacteroides abscessus subsp. massiliense]
MMVCVPIALGSKKLSAARARIPSSPPARCQVKGSNSAKTPMVFRANWTISVKVIDHMPPIAEYSITMTPPRITEAARPMSNSTVNIVAYAMVEVTASINVYAAMTIPDHEVKSVP